MKFKKLEIGKEIHYIALDLIGHWSVTPQHCDNCNIEHYVLDVYDRKGGFLCSMIGTKDEIDGLSEQIFNEIKDLPSTNQNEDSSKKGCCNEK